VGPSVLGLTHYELLGFRCWRLRGEAWNALRRRWDSALKTVESSDVVVERPVARLAVIEIDPLSDLVVTSTVFLWLLLEYVPSRDQCSVAGYRCEFPVAAGDHGTLRNYASRKHAQRVPPMPDTLPGRSFISPLHRLKLTGVNNWTAPGPPRQTWSPRHRHRSLRTHHRALRMNVAVAESVPLPPLWLENQPDVSHLVIYHGANMPQRLAKRAGRNDFWSASTGPERIGSFPRPMPRRDSTGTSICPPMRILSATQPPPKRSRYVVSADNKWFTRLVVSEAIIEALEGMDLSLPGSGCVQTKGA